MQHLPAEDPGKPCAHVPVDATHSFAWEKKAVPMPARLVQLLDKSKSLEYAGRKLLVEGLPGFEHLGKAPANNTSRHIQHDRCCLRPLEISFGPYSLYLFRCYLAWYNQLVEVLKLLATAWCSLEQPEGLPEDFPVSSWSQTKFLEHGLALLRSLLQQVHLYKLLHLFRFSPTGSSVQIGKSGLKVDKHHPFRGEFGNQG